MSKRVGNRESIELLRHWLKQAEQGEIDYVALAVVKARKHIAYDYAGAFGCEHFAQDALRTVDQELDAIQAARKLGKRDLNLDGSCVEWPLSGVCPFNWDFLIWLVDAEMTRRRLKAPAPLRVAFSRKELLTESKKPFFENVIEPMVGLIGGKIDNAAIGGRHKQLYVPQDIVLASRLGEEVPRLKASQKAREFVASSLHGLEPVTITLREAPHVPWRNSNLEAWKRFAKELERAGERVVFVRDTAMAMQPLDGFATFPRAAFSIDVRMALYEAAKVNCFVSNGPGGLALFSDKPYLYFVNLKEGQDEYDADDPNWWYEANGIRVGEQWPWASPLQRMIWKTDELHNLCDAWQGLNGH
jgi:hypothetical protein